MEVDIPPPDLEFTVYGIPAPKGSKRAFVAGGRAVVVDDNKPALKDWTAALASVMQAQAAMGRPCLDEPIEVHVDFFMPKPKSYPKVRRTWPMRKPDLDKLLRALFDPMTKARLIADDARIVRVVATKDFPLLEDRPRAVVRVWRSAALEPWAVVEKNPNMARRGAEFEARRAGG